jgi:hypothetical protein
MLPSAAEALDEELLLDVKEELLLDVAATADEDEHGQHNVHGVGAI